MKRFQYAGKLCDGRTPALRVIACVSMPIGAEPAVFSRAFAPLSLNVAATSITGFALAVTFVVTFALPPSLAPPDDVHRLAGGMFALSYAVAVIVPVACGAFWDLTGVPWTAFLPIGVCALTMTTLGTALTLRSRPA